METFKAIGGIFGALVAAILITWAWYYVRFTLRRMRMRRAAKRMRQLAPSQTAGNERKFYEFANIMDECANETFFDNGQA